MASELIDDALRTMIALNSMRIDCTSSREGNLEDDPGTMKFTLTNVGDDYHRQGNLDESDLVDHVRAILGEPRESVVYRGKEYVRDPRTGDWLSEDRDRKRRGYSVSETHVLGTIETGDTGPAWSEDEVRRLLLLFGGLFDPAAQFSVIDDGTGDGREVVHLRAETSDSIPFSGLPSKDAFDDRIRESLPPEVRKQIEELMTRIPDSFHYETEFWINRATKLIQRFESMNESLLDGSVVQRQHTAHVFSQFNEAQLPGPLPH